MRQRGVWWGLLLIGSFVLVGAAGRGAEAAPLLESRVGGLALVGPALDHPASVFYNPAALSLLPGTHVYFDGTLKLGFGKVSMQPVDPQTGAPVPGYRLAGQELRQLFPQLFLSASSDLGFDTVVLGLTLHTPFAERFSYAVGAEGELFDPAEQGPGRYHAVDMTLYTIFLTPSASIRIVDQFSIGFSFSFAFPYTDFSFVRDAALDGGLTRDPGEPVALNDCGKAGPCGYGSNAAAEAVRVRGRTSGLAVAAGVLVRPHPKLDIGAAYHSRVVGFGESNVPVKGDAWVRRSQASMDIAGQDPALAGRVARDLQGRGAITFSLPDMVNVGAAWRPSTRLLLDAQFRWIHFSSHNMLDVRLSGPQFSAPPQIPERLVHYRGFQEVFAAQLGAGFRLRPSLVLQGAAMLETAAMPAAAISPAAVDNTKLDAFVALNWFVGRGVSLHAGYGIVLMPPRTVEASDFSPSDVVDCVEARYDVDVPACRNSAAGRGLASTAGRYWLHQHRFGIGLAYDLW